MHELIELKEKLCDELEQYNGKEISKSNLEIIEKLSTTVEKLGKIIEMAEESEGYSSMNGGSYDRGYSRDGRMYYNNRSSYARNGRGRGSNARRDSMGRYSSGNYSYNDEVVTGLRELMDDAPDEQTRRELEKVVTKIERM